MQTKHNCNYFFRILILLTIGQCGQTNTRKNLQEEREEKGDRKSINYFRCFKK